MTTTTPLWSRDRLVRFGSATLLALVVAITVVVATADGSSGIGGRIGGDWASFRAAGTLVLRDPALLLDADAQFAEMAPSMDGGFLPFAYPPVFALPFVLPALLPFTAGYVVAMVVLAATAIAGIRATMDVLDVPAQWRRVGLVGGLTFAPVVQSVVVTQNATIRLWFMAAGVRALQTGRPLVSGLWLGGLWFKPQFAIPMIGLVAVLGRWRTAAVATGVGGLVWLGSALLVGPGWVGRWFGGIVAITDAGNAALNADRVISPVAWLRLAVGPPTGVVLALGVGVVLGAAAIVYGRHHDETTDLLVLTSAALLVTAWHAFAYEAATLVPLLGAMLVARRRSALPVVLAIWVVAPVWAAVHHPVVRVGGVIAVVALWLWTERMTDGRTGSAPAYAARP